MIEALEIGISLALGDGVSEGVAAARRDLHAIEMAMAAGAVSVQRLRDAAAGALGVAQAASTRTGGGTERPVQAGKASTENAAVLAASPTQMAPEPPSAAGKASLVGLPAGPLPIVPASLAMGFAPVVNELRAGPAGAAVQAVRAGPAAAAPPMVAGIEASRAAVVPAAPSVTILRMESQAAAVAAPVLPAGAGDTGGASVSAPTRREAASPWSGWQAPVTQSPRPDGQGGPVLAASGRSAPTPGVQTAEAPVIVLQPRAAPAGEGARDGAGPPAASAPAGQAREQAHMEGDVFLDGALVGRWMSNYLAREAGRASAGPTGFDARRNPLMPGATVGM